MYSTQDVDVTKLDTAELCEFIEQSFYKTILRAIEGAAEKLHSLKYTSPGMHQWEELTSLFLRLQQNVNQMIRDDEQIIFPIVKNEKKVSPCPARKLPVGLMQHQHQEIRQLLGNIRHYANDYIPNNEHRLLDEACAELFLLEQELQNAISIKEDILLKKLSGQFNQPCKGDCKHLN